MPLYDVPIHAQATRWVTVEAPTAREAARRAMAQDAAVDPGVEGTGVVEYGDEWCGRVRLIRPLRPQPTDPEGGR